MSGPHRMCCQDWGGYFLKLKLVRAVHEKYSQLTINSQSKKKNGKFYLRQPEDYNPGDSLLEGSKDSFVKAKEEVRI